MRKKLLVYSLLLILLGASVSYKPPLKTEALATQSINVTNASTSTVRSYYNSLNSKSESERKGDALLTSLKPILKNNHSSFSYATVWEWSRITDRDWSLSPMTQAQLNSYSFNDDPYVKLLYRSDNGTSTAAKHQDSHTQVLNREHVWPKSIGYFEETAPAGTDLHHLILADAKNNNAHGNSPYGNVNPSSYKLVANYVGDFTGKTGTINHLGISYSVYEPQDQDKGDIARAMFYMAARYSSYTSKGDPYLKLSNTPHTTTFPSTTSNPGQAGLLNTLLQWHELDPVDDYEIRRNNLIYNNAQFNRNPFIDYPSWVDAVWGSKVAVNPSSDYVSQFGQIGEVTPTTITLSPSSLSLNVGGSQTLSVNTTPANASKSVTWTSSNTNVASVSSSGTINALAVGTTTITAKSTLNTNIKGTATITVTTSPTLSSLSVSNFNTGVKLMDDYNTSNMVVTARYSNNSTANVTSNAIIETPDTSRLGNQSLTISYSENGISKFTTYNVSVTNNGVNIGSVPTYAPDLFISEYIEGTSNHKYLEIYNGTGQSVNLSGYKLRLFANGVSSPTNDVGLSGTLAHNSTIVYKNSSAALTLPSGVVATTNAAINFNGDDALGLYKVSTSAYVDIFGVIGSDPGASWTGGGVSTVDKTLVRKPSVTQGITVNPTTFNPSVEWIQYPVDTATYLGSHTMSASTPGITKEVQANAWAEYFLDVTSVYCEDLNGNSLAGSVWNELGTEYGYMDSTTKALYASTPSNPDSEGIAGAKARYQYLINKYASLMSNNFMRDGNNTVIFSVNKLDDINNVNYIWVLIVIFLSLIIFATYFFLRKKRFKYNQ